MVRKIVTGAAEMLEITQPVVTRLISSRAPKVGFCPRTKQPYCSKM
ncbi:hypothetical protein [Pseudomonas sp. NFX5]